MAKVLKKLLKVLDKVNFAEQNRSQFCVKKCQLRYLFSSGTIFTITYLNFFSGKFERTKYFYSMLDIVMIIHTK
jgi:hypothetical protein